MNKQLLTTVTITIDLLTTVVVWTLFMVFRWTVIDGLSPTGIPPFISSSSFILTVITVPLFILFIHTLTGYYINPIKRNIITTIFTTLLSSAIVAFVVFFTLLLDNMGASYTYYYYSLFVFYGLLSTSLIFSRLLLTGIINRLYRKKKITTKTLIIGSGKNAVKITKDIKRAYWNTIVGYISTENDTTSPQIEKGLILGEYHNIKSLIAKLGIKQVVIAIDKPNNKRLYRLINTLLNYDVEVYFTPRFYEILTGRTKMGRFGLTPMVSVNGKSMSDWQIAIKRVADISVSLSAIILLTPFFLLLGLIIKLDSKGEIFFTQERIGRYGQPFKILKFRTMKEQSEDGIPQLSSPNDDRITSVGHFLRRYRIDELPQLFNVLIGEMSIVGPRPERRFFIEKIIKRAPYYCLIYKVRPGLTSWGPIKIGYADTIEKMIDRLNYDIIYLENMSLSNDIKILLLTIEIIFKGKGI